MRARGGHARALALWVGVGAVWVGSGCVPLPFASPPFHATVETGVASGTLATKRGLTLHDATASVVTARVGLNPLQFFPEQRDRLVDLGAGYVYEGLLTGQVAGRASHGAYLEVAVSPWAMRLGETWQLRLSANGHADVLVEAKAIPGAPRHLGGGGEVGATLELVTFSDGPLDTDERVTEDGSTTGTLLAGVAYGETAIGLSLSGGFRLVGAQSYGIFTVGLSVRMPASAGIYLTFL